MQGKGSNPLKVLIKEKKRFITCINQPNSGWCHSVIKFHLHNLTMTLLNNSVELSSNLDKPVHLPKGFMLGTSEAVVNFRRRSFMTFLKFNEK